MLPGASPQRGRGAEPGLPGLGHPRDPGPGAPDREQGSSAAQSLGGAPPRRFSRRSWCRPRRQLPMGVQEQEIQVALTQPPGQGVWQTSTKVLALSAYKRLWSLLISKGLTRTEGSSWPFPVQGQVGSRGASGGGRGHHGAERERPWACLPAEREGAEGSGVYRPEPRPPSHLPRAWARAEAPGTLAAACTGRSPGDAGPSATSPAAAPAPAGWRTGPSPPTPAPGAAGQGRPRGPPPQPTLGTHLRGSGDGRQPQGPGRAHAVETRRLEAEGRAPGLAGLPAGPPLLLLRVQGPHRG